jgi:hypothetical protein
MAISRRVRWLWVAGGSLFTVAAIGFGTVQTVAALAHEERDVRTVVREPVRFVDVDASGSVTIVGGNQRTVTIDERVSRGLHAPRRSIRVDGDRLSIRGTCDQFPETFCSDDFTIRVPRAVRVIVRADHVDVSGVRGAHLESNGGDVVAARVSGTMRLRSHGGNLAATQLRGVIVDADSSGGDVTLSFATSPRVVDASSSGGSVNVVLPDRPVAYRVETSASGGSTDTVIRTDPTSPRLIRAASSGGGISIRYADG